jgi:hypothetical protein
MQSDGKDESNFNQEENFHSAEEGRFTLAKEISMKLHLLMPEFK